MPVYHKLGLSSKDTFEKPEGGFITNNFGTEGLVEIRRCYTMFTDLHK
jgi:hypothetical protein